MARDRIFLEGMVFYGYHGVHPEEKRLGQRFYVDIDAWCDLHAASTTDDVNQTVNYSALHAIARSVMQGESRNLIEPLAEEIALRALREHALLQEIVVTVRKPSAPVRDSVLQSLGVEVRRNRADLPAAERNGES